MSRLRKIWKFFSSMRFAILLLLLLIAACALGSFIPQGNTLEWYLQHYSTRTAALIVGTCFDDVFHSPWFLVLTAFLCCNLLLCNLLRLPQLLQRWKNAGDPQWIVSGKPTVTVEDVNDPEPVFAALRMKKTAQVQQEEKTIRVCFQNRVGLWGAWVCHLGILLLIVGFTLGQITKTEYTVYGVPGQTKPIGETGYSLTIDSFAAEFTESGTPSQFTASVTVHDPAGAEQRSAEVRVNEPGNLFGFKIFQNSTGTAARLTVQRDGEVLQDEVLCQGDYLVIKDTPVAIFFEGYDAEASFDDGQKRPVYDYSLYDMSKDTQSASRYQIEGEKAIETSVYTVQFSEPQSYTLLQLKQDRFTWVVLAGGLITLLGLVLAFYLQPRALWAQKRDDGTWTVFGCSRKGGALFVEQVRQAAGKRDDSSAEPNESSEQEERKLV